MILTVLLILCALKINYAKEGDFCIKKGVQGVCSTLWRCPDAVQDIENKIKPQHCVFGTPEPIICCTSFAPKNPQKSCILPAQPENGRYTSSVPDGQSGDSYKFFIINVTCRPGYEADGSRAVFCQDGLWSEPMPRCRPQQRSTAPMLLGFAATNNVHDKFGWNFIERVATLTDENFLLSPLGLKLALAVLTEAATGPTQAELLSVLGFDVDVDRYLVRGNFSSIINLLKEDSPEYILNLGSGIYVGDSAEPRVRVTAIAEEFYKTELRKTNFNDPAVAAREINGWVSNITHGRIPDIVNRDNIRNMVALILNTLYFKGTWLHQFPKSATPPGTFYVGPTRQIVINFMTMKNNFYYTESYKYDAKILRMPYRGNRFAMYIIVPNSRVGQPRVLLSKLSDLHLELANMTERMVSVTLPKFNLHYTAQLDGVLRELGVQRAFENTASLPGLARVRLHVSKVVQRSMIEVDELGSLDYYDTVNKFDDEPVSYEVIANRPFLFYIQDEATRHMLFIGQVADPFAVDSTF